MIHIKRLGYLLLAGMITFSSQAQAFSGISNVNDNKNSDFQLSSEDFESVLSGIRLPSDVEINKVSSVRDLSGLSVNLSSSDEGDFLIDDSNFRKLTSPLSDVELSWLVENNIVSRDVSVTFTPDGEVVSVPGPLLDRNNPFEEMTRSDLLVGVYKSLFGVIQSRPLVYFSNSWRQSAEQYIVRECTPVKKKDVDGNEYVEDFCWDDIRYYPEKFQRISSMGKTFKFFSKYQNRELITSGVLGDYRIYTSPNVYENYFARLLDMGIITSDSLSDMRFRSDYAQLGRTNSSGQISYPRWYSDAGPFSLNSGGLPQPALFNFISETSVLGKRFEVSGAQFSDRGTSTQVVISPVKNADTLRYFVDERIDTVEALRYIERMLRVNEKDMTDTEATVISYKYGASYLGGLDTEDRKTVMFLTAKGILNFEDRTEYLNLYGTLTKEFAFKLLYRLANKNARLDFSKIQLTDSDNFWIEQGYGQLQLRINNYNQVASTEWENQGISPVPDVITEKVEEVLTPVAAVRTVKFLGITISRSNSALADPQTKKVFKVTKVFDLSDKYKYKGVRLSDYEALKSLDDVDSVSGTRENLAVVFKVTADDPIRALNSVDSNIQIGTDFMFNTSGVSAVTKFDDNGKQVVLVPQSLLEQQSMISVLEDKVLKNKETGATAVLLKNSKIALVGNHVIDAPEIMVELIGGEVYYNLEVIRTLMTNSYISSIDPNSIYFNIDMGNEYLTDIISSTGNTIDKTYVTFRSVRNEGGDPGSPQVPVNDAFVNISHMNSSSSFLVKTFEVMNEFKKVSRFRVIVEFNYRLPDKDVSFTNPIYSSDNPDFDEINSFMYERPEDPELRDWWDNNYEISNAIMNTFFKTKREVYVKSGYLVPNLTILYDDSDDQSNAIKNKTLSEFFQEVGTHFSSVFVNRFLGNNQAYNLRAPEGSSSYLDPTNRGGVYYPEKGIVRDLFPLWVHAMYNNVNGSSQYSGNMYSGFELESFNQNRINTTLWRNLMADRNLFYMSDVSKTGGVSVYTDKGMTFLSTFGDSVFKKIDPSNTKFPITLKFGGRSIDYSESIPNTNNMTLHLETRTEVSSAEIWVGRYITERDERLRFYVQSVQGNKIRLVDADSVHGYPVESKKDGKVFYDIQGDIIRENGNNTTNLPTALRTRYEQLASVFSRPGFTDYSKSVLSFDKADVIVPNNKPVEGWKTVYLGGKDQKTTTPMFKTLGEVKSIESLGEEKVWSNVVIDLDMNYWKITDQGYIAPVRTFPFLQVGNVYFTGIVQGVIDSIMMAHLDSRRVNDLPEGSRLYVGDIVFTKKGGRFVSDTQRNKLAWDSVLRNASESSVVLNGIFRALSGLAINNSGKSVKLSSFITDGGLSAPIVVEEGDVILGSYSSTSAPYIHSVNATGGLEITQYDINNIPTINGVSFFVQFGDSLFARKMDVLDNSYQLLMSSSANAETFWDKVPFFNESLKLQEGEDLLLLGTASNFRPLDRAGELRDGIVREFNQIKRGNIFSLAKLLGIVLMMFGIVNLWIVYAVLKFRIFEPLLVFFRNPYPGSDRKGFDPVVWMSLGLFNQDSEVSTTHMLIATFMMFVGIYLLARMIT